MNRPLKLEFVQGPRDGESIEYKPGSTVTIGRVVRGNKIAIKDKGISTKHLRIDSDSEKWVIQDLGSSNGTILNSETLDPDTPVTLSHGDVIKLGEITSIVVSFVINEAQAPEHKLPPRPRRNNKRNNPVPDPDPVSIEPVPIEPVVIEPVQEKPTRKGRSLKQEESEVPKRATRGARSKTVEVEIEKEVKSRVGRPRKNEKKVEVTNVVEEEEEEEVAEEVSRVGRPRKNEKKVEVTNVVEEEEEEEVAEEVSRVCRGKKTASLQNLGLNSIKLEVEDTPKVVEVSVMNRARRGKQLVMENVKCEDTCLEEKKGPSRATRSRKKEIGGDSYMELDMVLNQARKGRVKRKQTEQKPSSSVVVETEVRNDDVEEDKEDDEDQKVCSEKSDEIEEGKEDDEDQKLCSERSDDKEDGDITKRVEQVEIELRKSTLGEEEPNCSVIREDGETENLQDTIDEERDGKSEEEKVELESRYKNVEKVVDFSKMTAREWFESVDAQLVKQITEETEKLIEPMRNKALRVQKYIAEQMEAKGSKRA